MAEARRFADLKYGHAGLLTYTPHNEEEKDLGQPGSLHSSHIHTDQPHFEQLGSTVQAYVASCSKPPQPTHSHLWAERQLQKRWLQKAHPEAFGGISSLPAVLNEEVQRFRKVDDSSSPKPIIAVGEMTDLTTPSKPKALPVLAAATGEAGELLRLTRLEDSEWSWDGRKECTLAMPAIDHDVEVDEVIWGTDGPPITQLKFAQSGTPSGTVRWLLVQKQTATMMLKPEFSRVPKTKSVSYQATGPMLSRIDPKLVLTLNHRQTGGNAHVDMAFNPPVDDRPPQLCVIDECGYWTLWNVTSQGRMGRKPGLTLFRGGHIWEGPLTVIPPTPQFPAEVHGVLFLGKEYDNLLNLSQEGIASKATRSKLVLLWNSEHLKLVDTEANIMLPDISGFITAKSHHGHIVDVQMSPIDQNHVYVLTVRYLVWIELKNLTNEMGPAVKPRIRLVCPHLLPDGPRLKMATTPYMSAKGDDTLVHVYSSSHDQISAHWFHLPPGSDRPQWHSQLMTVSTTQTDDSRKSSTFRDLLFLPLSIDILPRARGPGAQYFQQGIRFFQGWLIGHDLSVHYCMCIASTKPKLEVILPHKRLNWTNRDKVRKARHRRKNMLQFLGRAAVVPDTMTDEAIQSLQRQHINAEEDEEEQAEHGKFVKGARPIKLNLSRLVAELEERLDGPSGTADVSIALLEAVQGAVHHGFATGRLPLTTWQELAGSLDNAEQEEAMPPQDIEEAMQGFLLGAGDEAVITQLTRRREKEPERSLGSLLLLENQLSSVWVEPPKDLVSEAAARKRGVWVSELAKEIFLSTHGVAVQDVPLFGNTPVARDAESQPSLPTHNPIQLSQPSSSIPSSPVSMTGSTAAPDEALQRLSLLAPGIQPGTAGMSRPAAVLDFWPSERGTDPTHYISSVAIATDRRFDVARQRYQKIEKKKKAMKEKLQRPAFKRKGFPDSEADSLPTRPQIQSSQAPPIIKSETQSMSSQGPIPNIMSSQGPVAGSSQTQPRAGMTMSQVVPGVYGGDRKKAKKTKKKSGFR